MKRRQPVVWIGVLLLLAPVALAGETKRTSSIVDEPRVLVIAHRGNSSEAPENTVPAFESAVGVGCDLIELDYHHTSDQVPVVIHDHTLDRTTDARQQWSRNGALISAVTAEELGTLDAGRWFDGRFAGTHVPTLDESLDVIQQGSMTLIERKAGDAKTCVELLRRRKLLDQVVVQAFDWNYVADCHREEPSLVLAALGGRGISNEALDRIEATGARIVAWHHADLNAAWIEEIHRRGLRAWCFTVNNQDRVAELLAAGIDGIITDVPAQVKVLVDEHNAARVAEAAR